ncbi:MAG TPA: hypothetical protein QGI72_02170 [Poseidonia sp.]|nr:hypothetical protein [Poseidonia sp.]
MLIYHFNRCSKSRNALNFLIEQSIETTVIDYQKHPPSKEEIRDFISRSSHSPIEFVRMGKDVPINKDASEDAIIEYLSNHPKDMQRPIVDDGSNVIIARPLELLESIPQFSGLFSKD